MSDQQATTIIGNHADAGYHDYLHHLTTRFLEATDRGKAPVFATDATDLWPTYLDSFTDPIDRQYHNCHACRQFIERFGSIVTIGQDGRTASAIWHEADAPDHYRPAIAAMAKAARRAKVTGPFLSSDRVWGSPVTGAWQHLSVTPPESIVYRRTTLTAGQKMAEKREDFKTVMHALNEFTQPHIETALTLLRTDSLYRSEKALGQAEWLHALHVSRAAAHGPNKANVVWLAIATAPAGFCHPRSSIIGTLLEDIAAGMEFSQVASRFAAKMHPLQYQRPQAAPSSGAIAAAEKIVSELGAAGSLTRRFCRLDEIQALWAPRAGPSKALPAGIFGHLATKDVTAPAMSIPAQTMTWDKFHRTVLPTAERIEMVAPARGSYTALVTASNPDAPPILQWDRDDARNPVSWYFWHGGSTAEQFGLYGGRRHDVEAITLKPSMWNVGSEHHGKGVMFVIAGAKESRGGHLALFPEIMRSEFHGIRSVIEAYSRGKDIEGLDQPHAAGVMLGSSAGDWGAELRVWSGGRHVDYRLDRWD